MLDKMLGNLGQSLYLSQLFEDLKVCSSRQMTKLAYNTVFLNMIIQLAKKYDVPKSLIPSLEAFL